MSYINMNYYSPYMNMDIWQYKSRRKIPRQRKAPGAPKRGKSPYIIFSMDLRDTVKRYLPKDAKVTDVIKHLAEIWKSLNDHEKIPWIETAEYDKQRYETEMACYNGPLRMKETYVRCKTEEEIPPKTNLSAFQLFTKEICEENIIINHNNNNNNNNNKIVISHDNKVDVHLKVINDHIDKENRNDSNIEQIESNNNYNCKTLKYTPLELTKYISNQWQNMTSNEKENYFLLEKQEEKKYLNHLKIYQDKQKKILDNLQDSENKLKRLFQHYSYNKHTNPSANRSLSDIYSNQVHHVCHENNLYKTQPIYYGKNIEDVFQYERYTSSLPPSILSSRDWNGYCNNNIINSHMNPIKQDNVYEGYKHNVQYGRTNDNYSYSLQRPALDSIEIETNTSTNSRKQNIANPTILQSANIHSTLNNGINIYNNKNIIHSNEAIDAVLHSPYLEDGEENF